MACRLETPAVKIEMSVKASLKIFCKGHLQCRGRDCCDTNRAQVSLAKPD